MNNSRFPVVVLVGLALVALGLSAFTVNERELAIKLQVGEVVASRLDPGLHFKIPVLQTVRKFPSRILKIDDAPQRVFTLERTAMTVDYFVKWQIVDEVPFYTSTGGSLEVAMNRLREIIKNSIVTEFGKRTVQQAISVDRAELMVDILQTASATATACRATSSSSVHPDVTSRAPTEARSSRPISGKPPSSARSAVCLVRPPVPCWHSGWSPYRCWQRAGSDPSSIYRPRRYWSG